MEEKELPKACKICIKLGGGDEAHPLDENGNFTECYRGVYEGGTACLPKDRAMIVLLHELLEDSGLNRSMIVLIYKLLQAQE